MLLFIVGFMGAGKSGIGREAAKAVGARFVDTDKEVEALVGMTVNEIFEQHGEEFFRAREREVLESLTGDAIVATGGGLPCQAGAMEWMNEKGRTVYLKLSPEKLLYRLRHGQARRPKLHGLDEAGLLRYIKETLPTREPFYMRSSMIIDCDRLSDASVANYVALFFSHS